MSIDWEATFVSWGKPPSQTERDTCENAERAIRSAIEASDALSKRKVSAVAQGSYRNRTNVRADSDVDICILCKDSIFFDNPDGLSPGDLGISTPADYSFSNFKSDVNSALVAHFGGSSITRGGKAFDIHENTYRVDADAVPAFEYRRYNKSGSYLEGVSFLCDDGTRIINWPEQCYANGVKKNDATSQRFKALVRILKRLRIKMEEDGILEAKDISSFLIECLVWNVENEGFGHDALLSDVRFVLAHLYSKTCDEASCSEWGEISELKYLFRGSQPWTRKQANSFVYAAWNYIGLK